MEGIKSYETGQKWFHENSLLIKNNEAILDEVPVRIVKGAKHYSASDDGFLNFRGRLYTRDAQLVMALRLVDSDYIIFRVEDCEPYSKVRIFPLTLTSSGLVIDGILYRPAPFSGRKARRVLHGVTETSAWSIRVRDAPCPKIIFLRAAS